MKELYTALISAQAEFKTAIKDVSNVFFKSKYADLESIVAAIQPSLTKYGLGFIQPVTTLPDGRMIITTTIIHISGQSIDSIYPVDPIKKDPQGYGSAITYGRRYALSSMLGVVTGDDDDGNEASGKNPKELIAKLEGEIKGLQDQIQNCKNQNTKKDAEIKELKIKLETLTVSNETKSIDAVSTTQEPKVIVNHAPQTHIPGWEKFRFGDRENIDENLRNKSFDDVDYWRLVEYFDRMKMKYSDPKIPTPDGVKWILGLFDDYTKAKYKV